MKIPSNALLMAPPWKRGEQVHLLIRKARNKRANRAGSIRPGEEFSTPWSDRHTETKMRPPSTAKR